MASRVDPIPIPHLKGYVFGEKLGAGSYGTVYKAKAASTPIQRPSSATPQRPSSATPFSRPLPSTYAIKCIDRKGLNNTTRDLLVNEIRLLKQIKHENIVEMYDFQYDENYIYIVMEYCAGGDLSMFIRSKDQLPERRARPFVQQIAKAIKFLYDKHIAHMDLKPENVLLTTSEVNPTLKIGDFGVAQHISKNRLGTTIRGTLLYMAPEILSSTTYDARVDLWSIGVILYECLFGRPPFVCLTVQDLVETIKSNEPIDIPADARITTDCRDLLTRLLQRDPTKRIRFEAFFRHPFVANDISSQLARADELLQTAIAFEQAGNLNKALKHRICALDEYASFLKIDPIPERRRAIRRKVQEGIIEAENLKRRMHPALALETSAVLKPQTVSPTVPVNGINLLELSNDPNVDAAYKRCQQGNVFANQRKYRQACEEYESGISGMLTAMQSETNLTKKKILHDMISSYLTKAENCKKYAESETLDLQINKIKEDNADLTLDGTNDDLGEKQQQQQGHCLVQ
ncbi:unnamed protein product [Didymodactylos carnosus]|uniref:non-specific serine/threonine protein kinase n=1 Tax=Didymodactylos carnosus TaxID=1234261 RepID=A0A813YF89_9BILA|nr:unnamed protein product [Didymodactylos carnosus]CAF3669162.1 unnamed protein product [Didymodactylos carnosus]